MENFNWEEFKNENNKTAVHCDTKEKASDFLEQANQHGLKWYNGNPIISRESSYHCFKHETCYHFVQAKEMFDIVDGLETGNLELYEREGCVIIEWEFDPPKKFFYVAEQSGEELSLGVVKLTEEEHKVVQNFLNQVGSFADGECGYCGICDEKFNTEKEAVDAFGIKEE